MITYYQDNSVKLTHIPTGITIIVNNSRSRHKNIKTALRILKSKLWAINNGFGLTNNIVKDYDLPNDYNYANDDIPKYNKIGIEK